MQNLGQNFLKKGFVGAFTLAEVLIVVGIIGVVAAIMIPMLSKNIQDYVLKQQFKKTYAQYYDAILYVKSDLGYMPSCYVDSSNSTNYYSECTVFHDALIKRLKVLKKCNNNAYAGGCISEFTGATDLGLLANGYWTTSFMRNNLLAYRLADGTWITSVSSWSDAQNYVIDINGDKKPNKWGYDIYNFQIASDGNKIILNGWGNLKQTGGRTFMEMRQAAFN